jgi:hypothetical protein
MSTDITTKRFTMILKDGSRFFLDDREAEAIKQAVKGGSNYLEIGDSLISIHDFSRLVGSENYEQANREKRGEWKCKYGNWHGKFDTCACGDLGKYPKFN